MAEQQLGYATFNSQSSAGRKEARAVWGAEQHSTRGKETWDWKWWDLSTRASKFMMVRHTLKIRADNSYQLRWNDVTVSRDLLKHTLSVSRLDKNCTCFSTKRLTNKNTFKHTYTSPEERFFRGFSSFLFSSLLNRLGNTYKYYGKFYFPAQCWVLLNPSYLYKPVLCFWTM